MYVQITLQESREEREEEVYKTSFFFIHFSGAKKEPKGNLTACARSLDLR
jgi:hypothetical protein